jgi:restriction endonuclease Mrr
MATPDFQSFFYPFLKLSLDAHEHSLNELRTFLTEHFSLSNEEKAERFRSGA